MKQKPIRGYAIIKDGKIVDLGNKPINETLQIFSKRYQAWNQKFHDESVVEVLITLSPKKTK